MFDAASRISSLKGLFLFSAITPLFSSSSVKYTLSGWLGGYSSQDDNAKLSVQFLSATGQVLGTATIGPVLAAARNNTTELVMSSTDGSVPAGTTKITTTLTLTKVSGAENDGSADSLSLTFHL